MFNISIIRIIAAMLQDCILISKMYELDASRLNEFLKTSQNVGESSPNLAIIRPNSVKPFTNIH